MVTLITGSSGFIGYHLAKSILLKSKSTKIIGIDNMNSYYDVKLKRERKKKLEGLNNNNFIFHKVDITNKKKISTLFKKYNIKKIYHLAAQAGVRYSINNPEQYLNSNIVGFFNLLECARQFKIEKFFFASSSSVYGNLNSHSYFHEELKTDKPVSFYAATKKSNEIIAHSYSKLYNLKLVGLRFFTAYGPFGRPDMAYYNFTKKILNNQTIDLYNNGNHIRDFTYIDDVVNSILLLDKNFKKINSHFEIFNIGASMPVSLKTFIKTIEKNLGKRAKVKKIPFQKGDVIGTKASIAKLKKIIKYKPKITLDEGIKRFVEWYRIFHK